MHAPPKSGWAPLVAELLVTDLTQSLLFWRDCLGFIVAYERKEFTYLERPEGGQIMLCQRSARWETGPMAQPFGRGAMFQIYVEQLDPILDALVRFAWPIYSPLREVWRETGDRKSGQKEIFVQDPDGYLLMIAQALGERPL